MENLPDLIIPFKRQVYERVVQEFAKFANAIDAVSLVHRRAGQVPVDAP